MTTDWLPQDDNAVQWDGTPGFSTVIKPLLVGGGLALIGLGAIIYEYLTIAGIVTAIVLGTVITVYGVVKVLRTEYVITKQSIWKRTALLGTDTTRVKISDVQNTSYSRSTIGKLTGKGDVVIEVAGSDNITFERVSDYKTAHSLISDWAGRESLTDDIPGSIEQWQAIRQELRLLRKELQDGT